MVHLPPPFPEAILIKTFSVRESTLEERMKYRSGGLPSDADARPVWLGDLANAVVSRCHCRKVVSLLT